MLDEISINDDYSDEELNEKVRNDVFGLEVSLSDGSRVVPFCFQRLGALSDISRKSGCSVCQMITDTFLPFSIDEISYDGWLSELYEPNRVVWLSLHHDRRGDNFYMGGHQQHGLRTHKYVSPNYPRGRVRAFLSIADKTEDKSWNPGSGDNASVICEVIPMNESFDHSSFGARSWNPLGIDTELPETWLRTCEHQHGARCGTPLIYKNLDHYEDILLLDVRNGCLVSGFKSRRYVALSYVWGKTQADSFQTTISTLPALREAGSIFSFWDKIATTIKDAICFVQDMKEQYLWVDALCILQDDPTSNAVQINNMDAVFRQALLTIVAADGEDANAGLVGGCSRPRERLQRTYEYRRGLRLTASQMCDLGNVAVAAYSSPWSKRAWTYQERHFSKRLLIFMNSTVYWSCSCLRWAEDRINPSEHYGPPWDYYDEPVFVSDNLAPYLEVPGLSKEESLAFVWQNIVQRFSSLTLTYENDILRSLAGLHNFIAQYFETRFNYGQPVIGFLNYLCWFPMNPDVLRRRSSIDIPSWSWAGWVGEVNFHRYDTNDNDKSLHDKIQCDVPVRPQGEGGGEGELEVSKSSNLAIQFHTMWNRLRVVAGSRQVPFKGMSYRSCFKFEIVDEADACIGIVSMAPEEASITDTAQTMHEFMIVSNEIVDSLDQGGSVFYWLLIIRWKNSLAERIGVGRVESAAWHATSPVWKDITLV